MGQATFPMDAVLFDLDGTLVATDRFWVAAAETGARRAFAELELGRRLPTAEEWMSLVGLPLAEGFDRLFNDLSPEERAHVLARCVEEENRALARGGAALLPGAQEVLEELHRAGVKLGIASNCSMHYLRAMIDGLGLGTWVQEARCLESPGITDKASMLTELLDLFGTRRAVMVGDRAGDAAAAHANGLPHIHLRFGFAPRGEHFAQEAVIDSLHELLPLLRGAEQRLSSVVAVLGLGVGVLGVGGVVAVTGSPLAGKSLLAEQLVETLTSEGQPAGLLELEVLRHTPAPATTRDVSAFLDQEFDRQALVQGLLEPLAAGRPGVLPGGVVWPADRRLVLAGPWLDDEGLRPWFTGLLRMTVTEELALRRQRGILRGAGATREALEQLVLARWPRQAAWERDGRAGGLVLDGSVPWANPEW